MSAAIEYVPAPFFPPAALANATASLPPDPWGGVGWVTPGYPPLPPSPVVPPWDEGRRRRRRRRRRRQETSSWASSGDHKASGSWDRSLNTTGPLGASVRDELLMTGLNLTAEDVDYMLNMSFRRNGVLRWGGSDGVGPSGYPLNPGHRRNNTATVQRSKMKGGNQNTNSCYCESTESMLLRMVIGYRSLHPLAALTVCVLGTLANALNVAVLTRPHLAPAPVNRILTAIAAADAALMAEYAAYVIFVRLPQAKSGSGSGRGASESPPMTPAEEAAIVERKFPFAAAAFVLFHTHFSQVMHTVSICLTLTLAVWRYLALRLPPERARILCSRRRCSVALAVSVLLPPLLCTPSYLLFGIDTRHITIEPKYHHVAAASTAIRKGSPEPPVDYTLDPGLMIPTAAMASLDVDYGPGPSSTLPSVSAALRQMAWAAAPPLDDEEEEEEEVEEEEEDELEGEWATTEASPPWGPAPTAFSHYREGGPTHIVPDSPPPTAVAVVYIVELSEVAKDKGEMLYIVNFWVYAVMLKLLPCLVLTVISVCLVRTLCRAKTRRRALQGDVKKAPPPAKAFPICRWRKKQSKASVPAAVPSRTVPPSAAAAQRAEAPRRERPLDDGGVWMGREEETPAPHDDEEEEEPGLAEVEEEEEGATLVQEPSSRGAEEGEAGPPPTRALGAPPRRAWWPDWLTARGRASGEVASKTEAAATVGAAVRRRRRRTERTTRMLVAVLILFLVTEFPQGVLGLMSGLLGRCFFRTCYHIFGDLMDLLALLNGSINFILYCAMSRQFRQTFAQLFCKHPKLLWISLCKSCPAGHENAMEIMKNGNMGGEGLRKGATTVGGQPSQSMGEVQSTYV